MEPQVIKDEPSGVYHAMNAITSSAVRAYLKSPQYYRDYMDGIRPDPTYALEYGTATHYYFLEPEKFAAMCVVKPEGLNLTTKEGKAWKLEQGCKRIIQPDDFTDMRRMRDRMPLEVADIIAACDKEVTVRVTVDGLNLQCRPDLWDINGGRKFDLKTINDIDSIHGSIWKRGYHIQDRYYTHVIKLATGKKTSVSDFIFVEKQPPYRWRIVSLDPDYQMLADHMIGIALRGIGERTKSGVWKDSEDDLYEIASPPEWATEHYDLTNNEEDESL